ncbi:MAG: hypothetical protein VKL59_11600 [Nostocaceae cyanobacterium]|nr:hypothetical protein [Nostocaceae cyanobacterium]
MDNGHGDWGIGHWALLIIPLTLSHYPFPITKGKLRKSLLR